MDRIEPKLVTIFGGSGFVGTQIVQLLAKRGHRIRVAVRRPDLAGHVKMFGSVGQVQPIQANVRNAASVRRAVAGADIVINLAGVGYSRPLRAANTTPTYRTPADRNSRSHRLSAWTVGCTDHPRLTCPQPLSCVSRSSLLSIQCGLHKLS